MPRADSQSARTAILEAAETLLRSVGARRITIDAVAKQAGCAKGLVHYHYKTKKGLLEAVAHRVAEERTARWKIAFQAPSPRESIALSWQVLTKESEDGSLAAWLSLFDRHAGLPGQTVKDTYSVFADALAAAVSDMLQELRLDLTISAVEVGWYLGAVVNGMGLQLLSGAERAELEGAYAAAWLGVLSLGQPAG